MAQKMANPAAPAKSLSRLIREIVIGDAKLSPDDIAERCKKAGHIMVKRSTISTLRADCLATLNAARDLGWQEPVAVAALSKKTKAKKTANPPEEAPAVETTEAPVEAPAELPPEAETPPAE